MVRPGEGAGTTHASVLVIIDPTLISSNRIFRVLFPEFGSLFGPRPPWMRSDSSHGVRGGSDAPCETHGRRESTSCPHLDLHPLGLPVAANPCGQAGQLRDPPQGSTEGLCVLSPSPPLSPGDVVSLPSSNQAPGRAPFLESRDTGQGAPREK